MSSTAPTIFLATHSGTDLDGYASLVALRHIYPGAVLVLSDTLQELVREQVLRHPPPLPVIRPEDVQPDTIQTLIIADTQDLDRIGAWAGRLPAAARLVIYDHHPLNPAIRDRPNTELHWGETGSTCTLVTEELEKRGLAPEADDATLLLTGLYEDTGQLSFLSVTPRDFAAAHRLSTWGASPAGAGDLLQQLWDYRQTDALRELTEGLHIVPWGNLRAGISRAEFPFFMPDIGALANRMPTGQADAVFVLAAVPAKVFVIMRAVRAGVDVGAVARELGGGGHAEAASATLRNLTLNEAEQRLLQALGAERIPVKIAAELMSSPPIGLGAHNTMHDAYELMTRRRIGALIVLDGKKAIGILDYQTVAAALRHGVEAELLGPYVRAGIQRVKPETTLNQLRTTLDVSGERVFVVEREGEAVGVVTRRDILRAVFEQALPARDGEDREPQGARRVMAHEIHSQFGETAEQHLRELGRRAHEFGLELFLVGGCVRDLVMRKKPVDWDLVAVGDTRAFTKFLRESGAKVKVHGRFHTAHISYEDGIHFDLATARTESYARPGSLPDVVPAGIEQDLFRRDFSINAMALSINPGDFGRLIDRFRGLEDIKHRKVRVLHSLSFIDDPTRAFRALRLAVRFGFETTEHTRKLLTRVAELRLIRDSEGTRLRRELLLAFREPEPLAVLRSFDAHGLLRSCLPDYQLSAVEDFVKVALDWNAWYRLQFGKEPAHVETLLLGTLAKGVSLARGIEILEAFKIPLDEIERWAGYWTAAKNLESELVVAGSFKTSHLFEKLIDLRHEVLLTWAILHPHRRELLVRHLTDWVHLKPAVTGEDLQQIGVPPGPEIGKWLTLLRNGLLDGNLPNEKPVLMKAVEELRTLGRSKAPKSR